MHPVFRIYLLVPLTLAVLTGCLSRAKAPVAARPSLEYQATLAQIVRVPQPNPLLDEGMVPLRAIEIVAAYQDIARRGRYRELARFFDPISQATQKDILESRHIRRETEYGPALEVLRDVTRTRDTQGVRYAFEFESVQRATSQRRYVTLIEWPDGTIFMAGDGT
jgi:hypothetical protein